MSGERTYVISWIKGVAGWAKYNTHDFIDEITHEALAILEQNDVAYLLVSKTHYRSIIDDFVLEVTLTTDLQGITMFRLAGGTVLRTMKDA